MVAFANGLDVVDLDVGFVVVLFEIATVFALDDPFCLELDPDFEFLDPTGKCGDILGGAQDLEAIGMRGFTGEDVGGK